MHTKLNRGFTLIELLVVISIIGLLSSVVLSSLQTARVKARNAERAQGAVEYAKAVNLAYDTYGEYPDPLNTNPGAINTDYCMSNESDNICGFGGNGEDSDVHPIIAQFLPGARAFPTVTVTSPWWTLDFQGPTYRCTTRISGACTQAQMTWLLEGAARCGLGAVQSTFFSATSCTLTISS